MRRSIESKSKIFETANNAISTVARSPFVRDIYSLLKKSLTPKARPLLFGGCLRNPVLDAVLGLSLPVRDIDLVIFNISGEDEIASSLKTSNITRTTYGGIKLTLGPFHIDIWTPSLQMKVAGSAERAVSPQVLLDYVTLSTDAVFYDPISQQMISNNFLNSIENHTIDLGSKSKWAPKWAPFHLAHLIYIKSITGFHLSLASKLRVAESITPSNTQTAIDYLKRRKHLTNPEYTLTQIIKSIPDSLNGV